MAGSERRISARSHLREGIHSLSARMALTATALLITWREWIVLDQVSFPDFSEGRKKMCVVGRFTVRKNDIKKTRKNKRNATKARKKNGNC